MLLGVLHMSTAPIKPVCLSVPIQSGYEVTVTLLTYHVDLCLHAMRHGTLHMTCTYRCTYVSWSTVTFQLPCTVIPRLTKIIRSGITFVSQNLR